MGFSVAASGISFGMPNFFLTLKGMKITALREFGSGLGRAQLDLGEEITTLLSLEPVHTAIAVSLQLG